MPVHWGRRAHGRPARAGTTLLRVVETCLRLNHRGRESALWRRRLLPDSIKNITCGEGGAVVCRDDRLPASCAASGAESAKGQTSTSWKGETGASGRDAGFAITERHRRRGIVQRKRAFVARRRDLRPIRRGVAERRDLAIPGGYDGSRLRRAVLDGLRDALMNRLRRRGAQLRSQHLIVFAANRLPSPAAPTARSSRCPFTASSPTRTSTSLLTSFGSSFASLARPG